MSFEDVGIIIPAYNEEHILGTTIRTLKKLDWVQDILVVDDGSQDQTANVARAEGASLLVLERNFGKGYALQKGVEGLNNSIIVFLDADVGTSAHEARKLVYPLLKGQADVTIAKFPFTPGKGGFGFVKGLSKVAFKLLTGKKCESLLSGQRGFRREILEPKFLNYKGYGVEFGMTVDLTQRNLRILEIPVNMHHRVTGKDLKGFRHRARQFRDISMVILEKKLHPINYRGKNS